MFTGYIYLYQNASPFLLRELGIFFTAKKKLDISKILQEETSSFALTVTRIRTWQNSATNSDECLRYTIERLMRIRSTIINGEFSFSFGILRR